MWSGLRPYRFEVTAGTLVIIATILLVAVFVAIAPDRAERRAGNDKSILAVLAFDQIGMANPTSEIGANLQDSLTSALEDVSGIKVIARSSVEVFIANQTPIHLINDELGATAYLTGSVERDGARIRIQARLVDTERGSVEWSRTYDRELNSDTYFDIQSDILGGVTRTLSKGLNFADQATLSSRQKTSLQASEMFYRAKRYFDFREVDDYLNATLAELEKALLVDPEYISALALKAHVELAQYWYASKGRDWIEKADATLQLAESLAPDDAGVMVVRGYYHYWGFRDYEKASAILEKAMDQAVNRSDVWELSAYVARRQGRFRETLAYLSRARELNPLDIELVTEVIETQATLGALQDTIKLSEQYLQRYPQNYDLIDNLDRMWRLRGDPDRAFVILDQGVATPDWGYFSRRMRTALLTQDTVLIETSFRDLQSRSNGSIEHFLIEKMYAIDAATLEGNQAEVGALQAQIKERIADTPFEFQSDWTPNGHWTPVDVPSYLGDVATVETIVSAYEMQFASDCWQTARHWSTIARALARIGRVGASMDYIEQYVTLYGPLSVLRFENNHVFEDVRQTPGYQRLIEEAQQLLELQAS